MLVIGGPQSLPNQQRRALAGLSSSRVTADGSLIISVPHGNTNSGLYYGVLPLSLVTAPIFREVFASISK
jgi:hypothetical protein